MSKLILPDGSPADSGATLLGPNGETLSQELPPNAPKTALIPILFTNKLTQEPEYSGVALIPLKDFVKVSRQGETEVNKLYTEIFLQVFVRELQETRPDKLEKLKTSADLYKYMVANYSLHVLPPITAHTIISLDFGENSAEPSDENAAIEGSTDGTNSTSL